MAPWHDVLVAEVGAAAALAGFLFLAIPINIQQILKHNMLPSLASHTLTILTAALVTTSISLIPASTAALATLLTLVTVINWLASLRFLKRYVASAKQWESDSKRPLIYVIVFGLSSQAASLPLAIGAVLAFSNTAAAFDWIAGGIVFTFASAIYNTWILLVEILR